MVRYTIKKTLLAEVNVQRLDIVFRTGISRCLIDMSLHICRNSIQCNRPQYIVQSPNQKIPDRKTKCVIKTHINIKQNVIFGAKLKPV